MQVILSKFKHFPFQATFLKFIYSGLIMRGIAIVLNYTFAEYLQLNIRFVYFGVLCFDFILGYLLTRFFVFNQSFERSHKQTLFSFFIAGVSFRALDWTIYILLVEKLNLHITFAQLGAIATIMLLKFVVYKKIFK